MNFRTATLLVLGMFGSFVIVITTMVFLFWSPEPKTKTEQVRHQSLVHPPEVTSPDPVQAESAPSSEDSEQVDRPGEMPEAETGSIPSPVSESARPEPVGVRAPTAVLVRPPGRITQKNLEIEQGEMKLLRAEMERRLKEQSLNREKKMDQLARRCENLEAGEAVQILTVLEDKHLGEVLKRMTREKALPIAALLERLGRGNAISLK
jgi:hypothetical protein